MSDIGEAKLGEIASKYFVSVPLDVRDALDTESRYAIFANVWLITPRNYGPFLQEIMKQAEENVWEKIKKANEK